MVSISVQVVVAIGSSMAGRGVVWVEPAMQAIESSTAGELGMPAMQAIDSSTAGELGMASALVELEAAEPDATGFAVLDACVSYSIIVAIRPAGHVSAHGHNTVHTHTHTRTDTCTRTDVHIQPHPYPIPDRYIVS